LDDFSEAVLKRAVASIGVGVVAFDQKLVARLDFRCRGGVFKPERRERAGLHILDLAALGVRPARLEAVAEEAERIVGVARPLEA
jgi:hypothetical protein